MNKKILLSVLAAGLAMLAIPAWTVGQPHGSEGKHQVPAKTSSPSLESQESWIHPGAAFAKPNSKLSEPYRLQAESMTLEGLIAWAEATRREYSLANAMLNMVYGMGTDNPFKPKGSEYGWGPLDNTIRQLLVLSDGNLADISLALKSGKKSDYVHTYASVELWNNEFYQRLKEMIDQLVTKYGMSGISQRIDLSPLYN